MRRKYLFTLPQVFLIVIVAMLISAVTVLAATGTTDSSAAPGSTSSYTLEDIYQRLDTGTAGSQSTFTEPSVAPGTGSMHTLNDIMGIAPALDNTDGATTADVLSGQTFWGLTNGEWGLQTGGMPLGSDFTGGGGLLTFDVPDGYYSGNTATAYDADLLAGNILDTVDIFGVTGSIPTQGDVAGADGSISFAIPDGYYSGNTATAADSDLVASNIRVGVTIFGVTGTYFERFTEHSDGTVTDNITGLMWTKDADHGMIRLFDAMDYCDVDASAGYSDWRLASLAELRGIMAGDDGISASSPQMFDQIQADEYWTSDWWEEVIPVIMDYSYTINLDTGVRSSDESWVLHYFWCVRN